MKWEDISLYKFQQIDAINNRDMDDLDKLLFTTCTVFDYTEYELDNMPAKKVLKLTKKVEKIFTSELKLEPVKFIGPYKVNYDPSSMTFGQYVELAFFMNNPTQHSAYILATASKIPFTKQKTGKHRKRADYFLKQPVTKVMGAVRLICEKFHAFNQEYKRLFELDKKVHAEDVKADPFNKRYGWIWSAREVAEYERITLDQAYALPVRQALNDLAYLKAKQIYDVEQSKKSTYGR